MKTSINGNKICNMHKFVTPDPRSAGATHAISAYHALLQLPIPVLIVYGNDDLVGFANDCCLRLFDKKTCKTGSPLGKIFPELSGQVFKDCLRAVRGNRPPGSHRRLRGIDEKPA